MNEQTAAWQKVLVIYKGDDVRAVMIANGGINYYEAIKMSHEEVGELHNAHPQNIQSEDKN